MSRQARKYLKNGFFHIMVQGIAKEKIFNKAENKQKYIKLMKKYAEEQEIELISYCVMDNHTHIIIYTQDIEKLEKFMKKLNTAYAMQYNKDQNRVGYVFRDRYKSKQLNNQSYIIKCIKYVHMNPVKAGITKEERQYKYSSYNDYINKTGIVTENLLQKIFGLNYNYLNEFLKIEYDEELFNDFEDKQIKQIDKEQIIVEFIKEEKVTIEELKNNKILIKKLFNISNMTQIDFAKQLGLSRMQLIRRLNNKK